MAKAKTATAGTAPAVASPRQDAAPVAPASAETPTIQPDPEQAEAAPMFDRPLVVRSVGARGRWRIGRFFTQEATEIPAGTITLEQATAISEDPELIAALSD